MTVTEYPWRLRWVWFLLLVGMTLVIGRLLQLNLHERNFLLRQGDARMIRKVPIAAHRGMVTDRHSQTLAVSAPVFTLWANPQEISPVDVERIARHLGQDPAPLLQRLQNMKTKEFMFLKRNMSPVESHALLALNLPGVYSRQEFQRYYPAAEVATHLVGFNNIDDEGQEGLELAYEDWLKGHPGLKLVQKDRKGRLVKDWQILANARPGQDLQLSIDLRMQYVAYRELKAVVQQHQAKSGSVVVLDVNSAEVLAVVNQPAYNPNNRSKMPPQSLRNRAFTDQFEPGSTIKPLTIISALMHGHYQPETKMNTHPGYLRINGKTIRDHRNYGELNLTGIITKSSNIGAAKLALSLPRQSLTRTFTSLGLGQSTGSGFPGESSGVLPVHSLWRPIDLATLSYGYGLAVTPVQLAYAYAILASYGIKYPLTLVRQDTQIESERVIPARLARQVITMMETVTQPGGTGTLASLAGYRVAGKTGTVHKVSSNGYQDDRYMAIFAGMVPASKPHLVCVVVIDEPQGIEYHGGEVAAPVFARIMSESLRLLNVVPDAL